MPPTQPRGDVLSDSDHLSVTLCVDPPQHSYGIAYRRACVLLTSGWFKRCLCSPVFRAVLRSLYPEPQTLCPEPQTLYPEPDLIRTSVPEEYDLP